MCGIVGYVGYRNCKEILIDSLKRLEYRGYDSAGIAIINEGEIKIIKKEGKLNNLQEELKKSQNFDGTVAIGHTRWATHGKPSDENAHPHVDCKKEFAIVHNGIIENYKQLKERLQKKGHIFSSQTDSEVIVHLIEEYYKEQKDIFKSLLLTLKDLKGAYAFCLISTKDPNQILAARMHSPLVIGIGKDENFFSSDIPALLNKTKRFVILKDGEIAKITKDSIYLFNEEGVEIKYKEDYIDWDIISAEKQGYKHFMLKEIHEQSEVVLNTLRGRIEEDKIFLEDFEFEEEIKAVKNIYITGCGTAYYAAMVGEYVFEELLDIPSKAILASEFRYRKMIINKDTLVLSISQSGETADTLAATREAKKKGAFVLGICNVMGSTLTREVDGVVYTRAGPEIGVASTKAFVAQLVAVILLGLRMAQIRRTIPSETEKELIKELWSLAGKLEMILDKEEKIKELARKFFKYQNFLYLGRGINYPIALEGALKLKEISYIHAEGYAGGEMKHGPIALIDESMPTVAILTKSKVYEKMISNIQEIKARDGIVIGIINEKDEFTKKIVDYYIEVPLCDELLSCIVNTLPLQLFAYYMARKRGCDIDQPRNLAKSVTVE